MYMRLPQLGRGVDRCSLRWEQRGGPSCQMNVWICAAVKKKGKENGSGTQFGSMFLRRIRLADNRGNR